ncbi:T-cell leukemia translocation-altered gene protein homolog isoform X2 [Xenopus laevis]|uniref:T-cell leukemia translocation-altered gene protein homolog n=2 Tax=Xenopus laevis TaxID=8355 RepID=A0A8J0V7K8_XENLA|nr:T-cell leukemia translocation-altered gene protein homolog isoform X2 [Xenopus laevis]
MMAETWASEIMTQALGCLQAFSSEFTLEWENSDMKAAIFKLLLGWIVLSVTAIQLAWKSYGATVNSIYYRQGMGGQNGGTPEYPARFPLWESSSTESLKRHQE